MYEINLVALVDKDIPTDHSFLEGVLAGFLPEQGVKVTFLGFGPSDIKERHGVKYIYVRPRFQSFFFRKVHKFLSFTMCLWNTRDVNVLFTRNDPVYLIVAWILKLRNRRLVHVHQISHLHAYSSSIKSWTFRVKSLFDILFRRIFFNSVDLFFLVSDEMRRFMETKWPKYNDRFRVVPLGIHTGEFDAIIPWRHRNYDLVYVGTLARSRRIDVLIDAVRRYNEKYGPVTLNIWGGSHDQVDEDYLRAYAKNTGQQENVIFNGKVSRAAVVAILKDSKIGLSVIPSDGLLKQISPTKLMEYMAAGCVVIASLGIPDQENIVKNAGGGYLIDFDADAVVTCIKSVFLDENNASLGALRARKYILAERSYEKIAAQIVKDVKAARIDKA